MSETWEFFALTTPKQWNWLPYFWHGLIALPKNILPIVLINVIYGMTRACLEEGMAKKFILKFQFILKLTCFNLINSCIVIHIKISRISF
jgi:hypothetical protein